MAHIALPPLPAELLDQVENQLLGVEVSLRQHKVFPRTMLAVEQLQKLIDHERRVLRHTAENKAAKAELEARLQAEKVDRCRAIVGTGARGARRRA